MNLPKNLAGTLLAALFLSGSLSPAADPELKHIYPPSGRPGSNLAVSIGAKIDPWPAQIWVDAPGIVFTPTPITGTFNVEIRSDATPGPHLIRLHNEHGTSEPRFFIIDRTQSTKDEEPNNSFKSPQSLSTLPAIVNGRLDRSGDVDSFAVNLKQGETLIAWLEAYTLASPFDGMLRIIGSDGVHHAFNHDGTTLDPFLTWEATHDGTFIVQVMGFAHPATSSVQFTGGEGCVYRLHITNGPFVHHTLPLAAQRGKETLLHLVGWNLSSCTAKLDCTATATHASSAKLALPEINEDYLVALSDMKEVVETEPNDKCGASQQIEIPSSVTGCIGRTGDEDCFTFTATKQHVYELVVTGARIGSSLDGWLRIEDKDGKELARNDDGVSRDPKVTWTAPSDGMFAVVVGDLTHRGGADFIYRLAISEAAPSVTATSTSHSVSLLPGKSAELKISVKPSNGFKQKLQLVPKDRPDGIAADPIEIPEKGGDVVLKLSAAPDAKPQGLPFRMILRETETGSEHPVRYYMTASSENNGVPQGYTKLAIDFTEQLWLTILVPPSM